MSEDEDPGYLPSIKPGDRVFIEFDEDRLTQEWGGWGTVVRDKGDLVVVKTDRDGLALSRPRHLLRAKPSS